MRTYTRNIADGRKILLLRNVFDIPRLDPRVQANASDVLRHCSTSTALLGMSIEYVLPLATLSFLQVLVI